MGFDVLLLACETVVFVMTIVKAALRFLHQSTLSSSSRASDYRGVNVLKKSYVAVVRRLCWTLVMVDDGENFTFFFVPYWISRL